MEFNERINKLKDLTGKKSSLIVRTISIGKPNGLTAAIIYLNGLVNKDIIDRDIMNPLLFNIKEDLSKVSNVEECLCQKYISAGNVEIQDNIESAASAVSSGKTIIILKISEKFIIADTTGGENRTISEPVNETSVNGPREGFVENIETNLGILYRRIKDKNLTVEKLTVGKRSKTDIAVVYIADIANKNLINSITQKIKNINIDSVTVDNFLSESIEEHPYSVFPQKIGSERAEIIQANLMEGRIAIIVNGSSYVTIYPAEFMQFFQTPEDYQGKSIQSLLIRGIRIIAFFIVLFLPATYISFIKFNAELIPVNFVKSLIQSREGIALTPFMSLLGMKITIEFLREGGLRLPSKIGQTLSVVGGIIIGDAALKAKIVSSPTLLVAGIATAASFVISNYQMSNSIRAISYPMLMLSNWLGMLGIMIGGIMVLSYLCSLENYGVPYFDLNKKDMDDTFVRIPYKEMKSRPQNIFKK